MIYAIARAPRFSPNSTERDALIFQAVVKSLLLQGQPVHTLDEALLPDTLPSAQLVLSMGRDAHTLRRLAAIEAQGIPVLNSAAALQRATRAHLDSLAQSLGVGCRHLSGAPSLEAIEQTVGYPLWLKRSDACAQSAADVRFIPDRDALTAGLSDFAQRGIRDFVAAEHIEGDLVKFYGVADTDFFHTLLPTAEGGFSKFGLEQYNGAPRGHAFSPAALKQQADAIGRASGMVIYGGDAIVRPDGRLAIVDFNDFPSFSPCVPEAAAAIAHRALAALRQKH